MPKLKNDISHNIYNGRIIDKESKEIAYFDDTHEYIDKRDGIKGVSVTTLIHSYSNPFDSDFWSSYKALESLIDDESFKILKPLLLTSKKIKPEYISKFKINQKDFDDKKQEILNGYDREREASCELGTKIHAEIENSFYDGNKKEIQKYNLGGNLPVFKGNYELNLKPGIYPEYLISYRKGNFLCCGQIDLCYLSNNQELTIIDHKGLALDTEIPTINGYKKMKDIKIGDILFDKAGNPTKVLNKSEIHHNPCYKITFDTGENLIADHEHKWVVFFDAKSKEEKTYTTEQLIYILEHKERISKNIPKIKNVLPLNCETKDLPIDPYVLGVWLGGGTKSNGTITQLKNSTVWKELERRGYKLSKNHVHQEDRKNVETRTVYGLRTILRTTGLLNNKHIPDMYLRASKQQRLDLLRGLMDTDGSYNVIRKRFIMNTSFEWQADGLCALLSSLGVKPTKMSVTNTYSNKKYPGYNVTFIALDFNPFLTRNQDIKYSREKDNYSFRIIKNIEKVDTVETQCIEVDSPTHTYLCTRNLIPTHNTCKKIEMKSYFNRATKTSVKMKYPLNNIDDANGQIYSLQLSMYAWMIQQHNPNIKVKRLALHWIDHSGNESFIEVPYLKQEVEKMLNHYIKHQAIQKELDEDKPIEI